MNIVRLSIVFFCIAAVFAADNDDTSAEKKSEESQEIEKSDSEKAIDTEKNSKESSQATDDDSKPSDDAKSGLKDKEPQSAESKASKEDLKTESENPSSSAKAPATDADQVKAEAPLPVVAASDKERYAQNKDAIVTASNPFAFPGRASGARQSYIPQGYYAASPAYSSYPAVAYGSYAQAAPTTSSNKQLYSSQYYPSQYSGHAGHASYSSAVQAPQYYQQYASYPQYSQYQQYSQIPQYSQYPQYSAPAPAPATSSVYSPPAPAPAPAPTKAPVQAPAPVPAPAPAQSTVYSAPTQVYSNSAPAPAPAPASASVYSAPVYPASAAVQPNVYPAPTQVYSNPAPAPAQASVYSAPSPAQSTVYSALAPAPSSVYSALAPAQSSVYSAQPQYYSYPAQAPFYAVPAPAQTFAYPAPAPAPAPAPVYPALPTLYTPAIAPVVQPAKPAPTQTPSTPATPSPSPSYEDSDSPAPVDEPSATEKARFVWNCEIQPNSADYRSSSWDRYSYDQTRLNPYQYDAQSYSMPTSWGQKYGNYYTDVNQQRSAIRYDASQMRAAQSVAPNSQSRNAQTYVSNVQVPADFYQKFNVKSAEPINNQQQRIAQQPQRSATEISQQRSYQQQPQYAPASAQYNAQSAAKSVAIGGIPSQSARQEYRPETQRSGQVYTLDSNNNLVAAPARSAVASPSFAQSPISRFAEQPSDLSQMKGKSAYTPVSAPISPSMSMAQQPNFAKAAVKPDDQLYDTVETLLKQRLSGVYTALKGIMEPKTV